MFAVIAAEEDDVIRGIVVHELNVDGLSRVDFPKGEAFKIDRELVGASDIKDERIGGVAIEGCPPGCIDPDNGSKDTFVLQSASREEVGSEENRREG